MARTNTRSHSQGWRDIATTKGLQHNPTQEFYTMLRNHEGVAPTSSPRVPTPVDMNLFVIVCVRLPVSFQVRFCRRRPSLPRRWRASRGCGSWHSGALRTTPFRYSIRRAFDRSTIGDTEVVGRLMLLRVASDHNVRISRIPPPSRLLSTSAHLPFCSPLYSPSINPQQTCCFRCRSQGGVNLTEPTREDKGMPSAPHKHPVHPGAGLFNLTGKWARSGTRRSPLSLRSFQIHGRSSKPINQRPRRLRRPTIATTVLQLPVVYTLQAGSLPSTLLSVSVVPVQVRICWGWCSRTPKLSPLRLRRAYPRATTSRYSLERLRLGDIAMMVLRRLSEEPHH